MYKVERKEAESFLKVWNKGGITLLLPPESVDFATDFANVVIRSFIGMCQQQVEEANKRAEQAQKPKIIMEGIR